MPLMRLAVLVRAALRQQPEPVSHKEEVHAKLSATLKRRERRSLVSRLIRKLSARPVATAALALSACLLIVFATYLYWHQSIPSWTPSQLAADHEKYLLKDQPAEFATSDAEVAARWLSRHVGFSVPAVNLSAVGAKMLGVRRCRIKGNPVGLFLYQKASKRISLYAMKFPKAAMPRLHPVRYRGKRYGTCQEGVYRVLAWREGAYTFVMVSGLEPSALLLLAHQARSK